MAEKVLIDFATVQPGKDQEWVNHFINLTKTYKGLELQYRIMLKAMECIELYAYMPEPGMPRVWFETMVAGKQTLAKMDKERREEALKQLHRMPEVVEYKKKLSDWEYRTYSNARFLEDMINVFTEAKDELYLPKVIRVYNQYPSKVGNWKKKIYAEKETSLDKKSAQETVGSDAPETDTFEGWPL